MSKIALFFVVFTASIAYGIGSMFIPELFSSFWTKCIVWYLHLTMFFIIFMGPFLSRNNLNVSKSNFQKLHLASYTLMGFYLIFLFFLIVKSIIGLFILHKSYELTILAVGLSIVSTFLGFFVTLKKPTLKNVKIEIKNLSPELKGLKIVQLSDVHVSGTIKKSFVEILVEMTNSLNPDIIALTGDFVDGLPDDLRDDLSPFKNLKSKYGTYYCPGNHEYYWGFENWMQEFKNINFNVLLNDSSSFVVNGKKVAVGGVHDLASHRINPNYKCDPDTAIAKNENADLKILLAHQPKSVQLIKKSKVDLVLSGHTHAGQFFPGSLFIFLFQPYVKGLHLVNDINLYINQGTGYWGPPNRLGTESEVTLIELT